MNASKDPISLIESAYSFDRDEDAWLQSIVTALEPWALSGPIIAYTASLAEEMPSVRGVAVGGQGREFIDPSIVRGITGFIPPAFFRRLHAPFPTSLSTDTYPRVEAEMAKVGVSLDASAYTDHGFTKDRSVPTSWGLCGGDARVESALVSMLCAPGDVIPDADRHVLDCFAAHVGAALRLRSLLHDAPTGDHASVDAVVAPDGRILDARGDARDLRESLTAAVRRSECARLRGATFDERCSLWPALVDGRWSIIESVESDGKRSLLLCQNAPRTAAVRALSLRERAVVQRAVLGHPFKFIGYDLGLPVSTVSVVLKQALRKLGVASRTELIRLFNHVAPPDPPKK